MKEEVLYCDVLVIGGGGAGCRAAIAAKEENTSLKVMLLSKGLVGRSGSTPLASWGYAAALDANKLGDSPLCHFEDTLKNGRGTADPSLTKVLAEGATQSFNDLTRFGVKVQTENGIPVQEKMPGETYPRSVLLKGGGLSIMNALKRRMNELSIQTVEDFFVTELLTHDACAFGATGLSLREGKTYKIYAKSVILAGGGYSGLWRLNDNPPGNTGECCRFAYEAGAELIDLEMALYYPTVLISPKRAAGLLLDYEACLAPNICDGRLINSKGEPVLKTDGLPARDELIAAMQGEVKAGRGSPSGGVYLDFSKSRYSKDELDKKIRSWISGYSHLLNLGGSLFDEPTEVAPLMHFSLGGIKIDEKCQTGVPGLFAAGECAGNIHGANRISGNALTETQVFGKVAGISAARWAEKEKTIPDIETKFDIFSLKKDALKDQFAKNSPQKEIGRVMDSHAGFGRSKDGLLEGLKKLQEIEKDISSSGFSGPAIMNLNLVSVLEANSMVKLSSLICSSALMREESRGHHRRDDFKETKEEFDRAHTSISLSDEKIVKHQKEDEQWKNM